jgi:hypothetical protein
MMSARVSGGPLYLGKMFRDMPIRAIDFATPFRGARWFDILPRRAARPDLSPQVLLHAGPPFRSMPPAPVINAAIQALLFDGQAADAEDARDLLVREVVQLRPAQDYGIATPLAGVVSASMLLIAVRQEDEICYAPIIEGNAPALRFGSAAPECLRRLREMSAWIDSQVAPILRRDPMKVDELIEVALSSGDECHSRTGTANEAMVSRLRDLDANGAANLRSIPAFVLPVFMAAALAALRSSRSQIEAIGGNGVQFGIRLRGDPVWCETTAQPPRGSRRTGLEAVVPLPAIGDSAAIDFCGLGGQALSAAPVLAAELASALPADAVARSRELIDPMSGIVDPDRIVSEAFAPLINLAILDRSGCEGLIGRGFYRPPVSLFDGLHQVVSVR